jgi:hypothetical protein
LHIQRRSLLQALEVRGRQANHRFTKGYNFRHDILRVRVRLDKQPITIDCLVEIVDHFCFIPLGVSSQRPQRFPDAARNCSAQLGGDMKVKAEIPGTYRGRNARWREDIMPAHSCGSGTLLRLLPADPPSDCAPACHSELIAVIRDFQ